MNGLEQFDAAFGEAPKINTAATIPSGLFTLTLPDGGHRTFKIWRKRTGSKFAAGRRVIGILIGPDNTTDYEMIGWVNDHDIELWKAHLNKTKYIQAIAACIKGKPPGGHELIESRTCMWCGRELTTPEAVERGFGADCWEIIHGGGE